MSYQELVDALLNFETDKVVSIVDKALNIENRPPEEIIEKGLSPGMDKVGERYERGEAFLMDLIVAADAFKKAMKVIKPKFKAREKEIGTVVMGTIFGDIHDLGKNLTIATLEAAGFKVIDLGTDVTPQTFASAVRATKADIVGISALITTTMLNVKEVIEELKNQGIRDDVKIMVGGAPVDEAFVKEIGADIYGGSSFEGTEKAKKAMGV